MSKRFRCTICVIRTICVILLIFCMGCIENEQTAITENLENNNSVSELKRNLVEDYYKKLDKAGEMASYINHMKVINPYSRPRMDYAFDEEVFYMNESEIEKIEYERGIITLNRQPLHFVDFSKIEELGTSNDTKINSTIIKSIVYTAFTPAYNLGNEQINRIVFSRNILLKRCSTEAEKNTLSEYFKTLDTWSKFKACLVYANVPMSTSDENRTFVIDNVEAMNIITSLEWKQTDLEDYFEFLDSSGFDSAENLLNFTRQFRVAKQNVNNGFSSREIKKIYEARKFVIVNIPQNSEQNNDISKSDLQMYFNQCDIADLSSQDSQQSKANVTIATTCTSAVTGC